MGKCLLRAELAEAIGPEVAWRKKSPVGRGSGFDALHDVLAEMSKAVEADIPAEGATRYLYHVFKQLGYTYRRGPRTRAPSAASSSAAATAPCAGGTGGSCQIPPRLRRLCGKNFLSAT